MTDQKCKSGMPTEQTHSRGESKRDAQLLASARCELSKSLREATESATKNRKIGVGHGINSPRQLSAQLDHFAKPKEVVRHFMPLVRQIARRYSQFNPDSMEDFVQVGSIGLLKAIKYYDPGRARSASFKTLATCYIRGEIRHYLRDHCSLVQVPRKLAVINSQLGTIEERLTKLLERTPTIQELAHYSGYTMQEILEAQQSWEARVRYDSFDAYEDEEREDKRGLGEMLPDRKYQDMQHASEERELVSQALKRLGVKTRQIVEFVFFYDLSQKEAAIVLGVSEMGVSRAVRRALKKLKEIMSQENASCQVKKIDSP